MPPEIRRATPGDADAIAAVLAAVADEGRWILTEPPVDVPARARRIAAGLGDGGDLMWLVPEAERVAGFVALHATQAPGVAALGMAVRAEHRGRGAGRALLAAALDHARSTDLHKVELEVFPDNPAAIALYAGAGFVVEGLLKRHYRRADGTLRDALVMGLALR